MSGALPPADLAWLYLNGLRLTLLLTVGALTAGLLLAMALTAARLYGGPALRACAIGYGFALRGTPLLVQLFLIYYGAAQFAGLRASPLWPLLREPFACAILAFALNTAAYTAEILHGVIVTAPPGERDAALALGLRPAAAWAAVLVPSAARRALPAYGNEILFTLHGTALASTVTLLDLTGAARLVGAKTLAPMAAFLPAATCYLAISLSLLWVLHRLERRADRHRTPR